VVREKIKRFWFLCLFLHLHLICQGCNYPGGLTPPWCTLAVKLRFTSPPWCTNPPQGGVTPSKATL
jgi:hypothetical protein